MIEFTKEEWAKILKGYENKTKIDAQMKKNMDAYVGDVNNENYLPRYSAREDENDFKERLKRSSNNYFNFPKKILSIYFNAIFRSTEPVRESDSEEIKRFWDDVDGSGAHIGKFIKEQVFILNQVEGGCLIIVDKPPRFREGGTITRQEQIENKWFPYAYVHSWTDLQFFGLDRWKNLEYIVIYNGMKEVTITGGMTKKVKTYKIWDKIDWWVLDEEMEQHESGAHNLGMVPVVRSFAAKNPKFQPRFQLPMSPVDEIVKLSLKIYELMSQLDQSIIAHVFLKIAMPETMFKKIQAEGMGTHNVLVYPDAYEGIQAHYVEVPSTELDALSRMIFESYPDMILEFASIRAKTDKPREESGIAKTVDSKDELDNLIDKAEQMEEAEIRITGLDVAWEGIGEHTTTISYSKNFDVKTINEQLAQMIDLFKQDLHAPKFAKEIVKRVARKMLGNVAESDWLEIEKEIEDGIDPALSLEDINTLVNMGALWIVRIARRYNPELQGKSDEEVKTWVAENMSMLRGVETPEMNFEE